MQQRQSLTSLFEKMDLAFRVSELGRTEFEDAAYQRGDLIIYHTNRGRNSYVATVSRDDIFDKDGMRFDDDT